MIASEPGSCPINSIVQELVRSAMNVTNIDDDNDATMDLWGGLLVSELNNVFPIIRTLIVGEAIYATEVRVSHSY